jgi:transcriptional regulator with PAS, ATPase and Fis domain
MEKEMSLRHPSGFPFKVESSWVLFTGPDSPPLLGRSAVMQRLFERIRKAGASPKVPCFVGGEPGVGKELVPRGIHAHSPLRGGPFVVINCGAIPEPLIESELFGHEKGSFNGAEEKRGVIEVAEGGAFVLDEVGEMSYVCQTKTLRFLGSGEFFRVGGLATRRANTRVIAVTNRCLGDLVKSGKFRQDFHDRLSGIRFDVPPLRQRMEDLELLVAKFLDDAARASGRAVPKVSTGAMDLLGSFHWPGNVRQLERLIHSQFALLAGDCIDVPHLRAEGFPPGEEPPESASPAESASKERRDILTALAKHRGDKQAAARELGIDRSTLYRRMKRLGLWPPALGDSP